LITGVLFTQATHYLPHIVVNNLNANTAPSGRKFRCYFTLSQFCSYTLYDPWCCSILVIKM